MLILIVLQVPSVREAQALQAGSPGFAAMGTLSYASLWGKQERQKSDNNKWLHSVITVRELQQRDGLFCQSYPGRHAYSGRLGTLFSEPPCSAWPSRMYCHLQSHRWWWEKEEEEKIRQAVNLRLNIKNKYMYLYRTFLHSMTTPDYTF